MAPWNPFKITTASAYSAVQAVFVFVAAFQVLALQASSVDPKLLPVEEIGISRAKICWLKGNDVMLQDFYLILTSYETEPTLFDASRAQDLKDKACYPAEDLQSGTQYSAGLTWRNSVYKQQYSKTNVTFATEENPCHAFGCVSGNCQTATSDGDLKVSCVCFMGYYGHRCEFHNPCVLNPCGDYPCSNTSTNTYNCICPNGREVDNPEKCRHIRPCENNPCGSNGICEDLNAYEYECRCNEGYFGKHCERMDPCRQVNCHNGGKCVNETNFKFHCDCLQGYMGIFCDQINPCDRDVNPCQNSGICRPEPNERGFICSCLSGFSGDLCEQTNPCDKKPCRHGGQCVPQDNSDLFLCNCAGRYYGMYCQYEDFCIPNPCEHGTCSMGGTGNYKCTCDAGWLGQNCEIRDECESGSPCKNGGECHMDVRSGTYTCKCPVKSGYWGKNCEYYNECVNEPCQHQGICRNMTYGRNGHGEFACECMGNFVGKTCESWDHCKTPGYCEYQGECTFKEHNRSVCRCRTGYYGERCENYNVCEVNDPCQHGGICRPVGDNGYKCECLNGYSGQNCELFDSCQNSPCKNGGLCVTTDETLGTFRCSCSAPFYGDRCERENYCLGKNRLCAKDFTCRNLTTMNYLCEALDEKQLQGNCVTNRDCLHGGACLIATGVCECKPPYFGSRCQNIDPCKDPTVCSGNGHCSLSSDRKNAICKCSQGFFGSKCEFHDACLMNLCYNNGNCVQLNPKNDARRTVCHCQLGYKGEDCSVMNQECVNNECLNGGICLQAVNNIDMLVDSRDTAVTLTSMTSALKRKSLYPSSDNFICKCPDKYKGRRCEILRQCAGKVEKLENGKGLIEWKTTEMGQVSLAACPFGSQSVYSVKQLEKGAGFAHRDCVLVEEIHGKEAQWDKPNTDNCDPEPQNEGEAVKILDSVLFLMNEADPWENSPESVEYSGTVLRNLGSSYALRSYQMAQQFFQIIDRILEIPSQIRFEAEVRYGTISRLLADVEKFMDDFVIADLPNPVVIKSPNVRAMWVTHSTDFKETQRNPHFRFTQPEFEMKLNSKLFESQSKDAATDKHRVQMIVFEKDGLYISQRISSFGQIVPEEQSGKTSAVLSVNIKGRAVESVSSENVQISFRMPYTDKFLHHCAFWQPSSRKWETMGLVTEVFENSTVCKSTHLTSFTVLKMSNGQLKATAPPSVLPFVGCGIACVAYSLLAVTYAIVRSARRLVSPGVVVHLSVSLLLLNVTMMFAAVKDRLAPLDVCSVISVCMHYLICTSLLWYCVEALFRYNDSSLSNCSSVFYKCAATAWGAPLIICGVALLMKMGLHSISDTYCRLTPELEFTFYALLLVPSVVLLLAASVLYLLHICNFNSGRSSGHTFTTQTYTATSPVNSPYLNNTSRSSASQTILVFITMLIFTFNWILNQVFFDSQNIHIFDFAFCFGNVIQSTLLFSTLCLLSDDARYAWHYFWAPSQSPPKGVVLTSTKLNYPDNALLGDNTNKLGLSFSGSCHSPSLSPNSPSPSRNGKCSNGTLTRNPGYGNHDLNNFNSLGDIRSTVANGAVIFGETREIKQAVACLNTQGSFGSSVSSGLNPDSASDRFQRGDPYAASYPQATTLLRENPSPSFSNPERESYV